MDGTDATLWRVQKLPISRKLTKGGLRVMGQFESGFFGRDLMMSSTPPTMTAIGTAISNRAFGRFVNRTTSNASPYIIAPMKTRYQPHALADPEIHNYWASRRFIVARRLLVDELWPDGLFCGSEPAPSAGCCLALAELRGKQYHRALVGAIILTDDPRMMPEDDFRGCIQSVGEAESSHRRGSGVGNQK